MKNEKIIEVNNLTAELDNKVILSGISCYALQGQVTVILGSSGSGKSTLLRHMLGLYPSTGEAVRVMGVNPSLLNENEEKAFYTRLGVFYQNGGLLNSLTVAENIALPLEQHTEMPGELIEKIVRQKLKLVNLEETYDQYPSQLSGGMLKRAALARAIIMDPSILFCDEPGAGLDPVSLAALDELIINLQQLLGMTIVIVTHEVSSILRIADRIIFLEEGKVLFQGKLDEGYESGLKSMELFFSKGRGE
ncbi:MAG: ATP-binding cassette domain-containing protein [Bacteroidales bacterium]|nr:ATP-binding cassette domain-containing protein [Bacteroidales bacterium]